MNKFFTIVEMYLTPSILRIQIVASRHCETPLRINSGEKTKMTYLVNNYFLDIYKLRHCNERRRRIMNYQLSIFNSHFIKNPYSLSSKRINHRPPNLIRLFLLII